MGEGPRAAGALPWRDGAECAAAEPRFAMDERVAWIGGALALMTVVAGALWVWSGESSLERELESALTARETAASAPAQPIDAALRSAPASREPEGVALRQVFREAAAEYEAASRGDASAGEMVHDRVMAIEALAQQIDRPVASASDAQDLLAIGALLETWFASDAAADVRDAIAEALAPQRSAITARVLWSALTDAAEDVRETALFHFEDILSEDERSGGEARSLLLERTRRLAADAASPRRTWAQQCLTEIVGGDE
ncbi:MAG: hypothetical protein IPN34_01770 [Planctomycetes bacterium]|nr:hypothetical protein [Planctomycetota bacterium]